MPRILVADDNSNIHRAIALALKDSGVEVIAVGNGEAAVRKLPDVKPDVVLADIFMPVRSGYEVCEFVKNDPRFSAIPVVLLIGAFDPFDEREAQRVKADAILKKPFVPPDALVRTVLELIERSAPKSDSTAKHTQPAAQATEISQPASEPAPEFSDAAPEEFATPRAPLDFSANDQTLAFGSLLETTTETDEPTITAQRDPNLGEPAFWAPAENHDELAEDASEKSEKAEGPASSDVDDAEQWELSKLLEPFPADSHGMPAMESTVTEHDALPDLPEFSAPVGHVVVPAELSSNQAIALPQSSLPELPQAGTSQPSPQIEIAPEVPVLAAVATDKIQSDEQQLPQLSDSASAWLSNTITPQSDPADETQELPAKESVSEPSSFATLAPFLATLAYPTAPEVEQQSEAKLESLPDLHVAANGQSTEILEPAHESLIAEAVPTATLAHLATLATVQPDPATVEAMVQRVIERMQPQMLDLVTRELLRPVVEALVRKELETK